MRLGGQILDLLFPPRCPFCRCLLAGAGPVCPSCQRGLSWTQGMEGEVQGEHFRLCVAPVWYRDRARDAFHRYKFSGLRSYAPAFGQLMAQCVSDRLDGPFDLVTWAPLSRQRLRRRGYDQAQLLAKAVGRALALPLIPTLDKCRHTPAQSGLEEEAHRRANALGAYRLRPDAQVAGKRILLVDDVITSGSTLSECARILRTAGAQEVWCVVFGRAR